MEGKGVNPQGVTVKEKQDRDSDQEFKLFCSILNRIKDTNSLVLDYK